MQFEKKFLLLIGICCTEGCSGSRPDSSMTDSYTLSSQTDSSGAVVGATKAWDLPINVRAFLDVIAFAERTHGAYDTMYGDMPGKRRQFTQFTDHPRLKVASPWGTPGISSDAAGRYQFLSTTWDEARKELKLNDFTPVNQDKAAVWLIQRNGRETYEKVKKAEIPNNFNDAVRSLSHVWASLPPQRYEGQTVRDIKQLWAVFLRARQRYLYERTFL